MMEAKDVLTNLKNYGMWDFKKYELCKAEADVIVSALEEYLKKGDDEK